MSITGIIDAPFGTSGAQTAADVYLQLGDVQFADMEVPDKLPFGGTQQLAVKKLLGGARVIDVVGPDDQALSWSGRFRGALALNRATYLDAARRAGAQLTLTWSALSYEVIIQSFVAEYERDWEIAYRISCTVVSDNRHPDQSLQLPTLDQVVNADLFSALSYSRATPLGDFAPQIEPVISSVAALQTTIGAAGALSGNIAGLANVAGALSVAQVATSTAVAAVDSQLDGAVSLAGSTAAGYATSLLAATTLIQQSANLRQTGAFLNRMSINLAGAQNQ